MKRVFYIITAILAAAASSAAGGELITGGDFETGDFTAEWVHGAAGSWWWENPNWADHQVVLDLPYQGNYSALLGFKYTRQRRNRYGYMYQDVTIPSNISSATLYFKFRQQGFDGQYYDPFTAEVRNTSGSTLETIVEYSFSEWNNQFKDSGWIDDDGSGPAGFDMTGYAGMDVRIYFQQINSWDDNYETWSFIDDVSLVYRRFVDLAVDSNGEDKFGVPGSGNGGYSLLSGEAGETLTYNLTVENEGLDADSYTITSSPPSGWAVNINYQGADISLPWVTPELSPGEILNAQVKITVPPGESTGGYSTILDAVSASHGNRYDSAELAANVVPSDYLSDLAVDGNGAGIIDPAGAGGYSLREVFPDTTVSFSLDLFNEGVETDSFRVWFQSVSSLPCVITDGAESHSGQFTAGPISSGGARSYQLEVTVSAAAGGGDFPISVFCQSLSDTLKKDGVAAVTRVLAPAVDAVICGSGDDIIDSSGSGLGGSGTIAGMRGSTVNFPVIIQNEAGVADSFELDWTPPGNGWSAVINDGTTDHPFPWTTPEIQPFSENDYSLAVTVPASAAYGTEGSILDIISVSDPNVSESVTGNISVSSANEIDMIIDGSGDNAYGPLGTGLGGSSSKTASVGDTLTFQIEVENESGENLFDLEWNAPSGWEALIGDSASTMRSVAGGVYTMEVRVPASCEGGRFSIIIDGVKTNKRHLVDSVEGTINVSVPRIVDGVIDGNGDGVFGEEGTGAGGVSSVSSVAGRTEQFSLELQNQGVIPESYRVEWNSLPGWIARMDGNSSGFVTVEIEGGDSRVFSFEAVSPESAPEGSYTYTIDIISTADSANTESVTASIDINSPPRADLRIQGDGDYEYGPAGSGEGGSGMIFGDPGDIITASLQISNRGGFPDSFMVSWEVPDGWPAGSVLISNGGGDHPSPFFTGMIDPGGALTYTVRVAVPADAGLRNRFVIDGRPDSRDRYDSILLETGTGSVITGAVFLDDNHNGVGDPPESGQPGVTVLLSGASVNTRVTTGGGGEFIFEVRPGSGLMVIEKTPAGMISITPDTVGIGPISAGDTVRVFFGDVISSTIQPSSDVRGTAGGVVDIGHTIIAGTPGQASIYAEVPAGWAEVFYRDQNGNGQLDSGDTRLSSDDLNLDPAVEGRDIVHVVMRLFIPRSVSAGNTFGVRAVLDQVLGGTSIHSASSVTSTVFVLANATGMMKLVKEVDLSEARPGDLVTYTIRFSNPGVEGVREIEIIDPVSESVELVMDAFGAGRDIIWMRGGSPVYLTADPSDPDEAGFSGGRLRVELSKQAPYTLESGMKDEIIYQVRVK